MKGSGGPAALSFVRARAARFGAGPDAELQVRRVMPLKGGEVVRLDQTRAGRPVLNAGLSVLILNGRIVAASGKLTRAAAPTDVGMSLERARQAALRVWPGARVRADAGAGLWHTHDGAELRPAWSLLVRTERPFGLWRVVLDARTGKILSSVSALISIQGKAYLPNPVMGSLGTVELKGLLQPSELAGELADAASCAYAGGTVTCTRYAQPDTAGDFLFAPEEPSFDDPFAEVHAYYHADLFHRWLADSFGFTRKGASQQIKVMVNFNWETRWGSTQGMYNAMFADMDDDGKGDLVFGQGKKDFAYDADVIYHEFTHSAVDETSNLSADIDELGFNVMPLALNEGFADYFSSAFAGDPNVGEYAGNGGIRSLSGPAACPDDLSGESHQDGLLWGRACWTIRTQVTDKATFDDMVYKTLVALDPAATIGDAANMLLKVAAAVDPTLVPTIQSELTARGLSECSRIIALAESEILTSYIYGDSSPDATIVIPGPFQYKIEVPADAKKMTINLASSHNHPGWAPSLGMYIRKGEPVSFSSGGKSTYDFVMPNPETSITLEKGDAEKMLEPGATYYVLPLNVGNYESGYQIAYSLELEPPPPEPDAGPPPLEPDAGPPPSADSSPSIPASPDPAAEGCSCRIPAAGSAGAGGASLLLLAGLLLGLRRRR